eukprot:TRINITY_DN29962_c0_g1_i1.p1 TRINITY_DN29962_c0_g1~~TRINITY_DN29962_c0_g1_i1.p1  ORF type:complete len:985 (+),score=281.25 TRINITY_DN29962_c0_g1_i1:75-3029(+)
MGDGAMSSQTALNNLMDETQKAGTSRREEALQMTGKFKEASKKIMRLNNVMAAFDQPPDEKAARNMKKMQENQTEAAEVIRKTQGSRTLDHLGEVPPILSGNDQKKARQFDHLFFHIRNSEAVEELMSTLLFAAPESALEKAFSLMTSSLVAMYERMRDLMIDLPLDIRAKANQSHLPTYFTLLKDMHCLVHACKDHLQGTRDKIGGLHEQVKQQERHSLELRDRINTLSIANAKAAAAAANASAQSMPESLHVKVASRSSSPFPSPSIRLDSSMQSLAQSAPAAEARYCALVQVQDAEFLSKVCPNAVSTGLNAVEKKADALIAACRGQRTNYARDSYTSADGYCFVFSQPEDAVWFACHLQEQVMDVDYPEALLDYSSCKPVQKEPDATPAGSPVGSPPPIVSRGSSPYGMSPAGFGFDGGLGRHSFKLPAPGGRRGSRGELLWRGLRLRVAIHEGAMHEDGASRPAPSSMGQLTSEQLWEHPYYDGGVLKKCERMLRAAHGGEVLVSTRVLLAYQASRTGASALTWSASEQAFDSRLVAEPLAPPPRPLKRGEVSRIYSKSLAARNQDFVGETGHELSFGPTDFWTRAYQERSIAGSDVESLDDTESSSELSATIRISEPGREDPGQSKSWHLDYLTKMRLREHVAALTAETYSLRTALEAHERWSMRQHDMFQGEETSELCRGELLPAHPDDVASAVHKTLKSLSAPQVFTESEQLCLRAVGAHRGPVRMSLHTLLKKLRGIEDMGRRKERVDTGDPLYLLSRANAVLQQLATGVEGVVTSIGSAGSPPLSPRGALRSPRGGGNPLRALERTIHEGRAGKVPQNWTSAVVVDVMDVPSTGPAEYFFSIAAYAVKTLEVLKKAAKEKTPPKADKHLPGLRSGSGKRGAKNLSHGATPMNTDFSLFGIEERQRNLKAQWKQRRSSQPEPGASVSSAASPRSESKRNLRERTCSGSNLAAVRPQSGRLTPSGLRSLRRSSAQD